jgi:tetratricopeptide (TPR) repeat protein
MRHSLCLLLAAFTVAFAGPASGNQGDKSMREAVSLFQRGAIYARRGDTEQSKVFFQRAAEALHGFPEAHFSLGHIALRERRYQDALEHYQQARDGYRNLGDKLYDLRVERFRDAQEEIRALRDKLAELNNPRLKVNNRDMERTKLEEDIHKLGLVRLPSPGEGLEPPGEVFFYIGNAQFHLGRLYEAVQSWEFCASKAPDFPLVYNNLAIGYLKLGRTNDASASLEKAERLGVAVHPELKRDVAQAGASLPLQTTR